ncbi:uncharacterized protein TM35_000014080 [Trypanosoma theileri]|uniref:Autophagy-related protein 101 n=1 Tax=Trypanosoma theileri TaxID=67003 RepID=A0A1X0P9M1_9TRYP|nr:uncharacterized protein TM35_000014080 [Trypanosoma theileri]ORC93531.1 hypothetical protein TM35_000014080 [Trypanosoma theileri]
MHTFYTIRYPSSTAAKGIGDGLPIRVTNKAMESLLFCIVHSIEFQSPLQPLKPHLSSTNSTNSKNNSSNEEEYVVPVVNTSLLLGNVTYVARSDHNQTLLISLRKAVDAACAIPIPEKKNQVPFELRVRLLRRQRGWLWHESRPLVEWVFRMIKTREEFSFPSSHTDSSEQQQRQGQGQQQRLMPHLSSKKTSAFAGSQTRIQEEGIVYSNDPNQIRSVLQFILKHSYEAIDLNSYSDFRSGELIFDVSVQEVS